MGYSFLSLVVLVSIVRLFDPRVSSEMKIYVVVF
jgi:hypothetical protein